MKKAFINNTIFRLIWPLFYGAMTYLIILLVFDNISQLDENFFGEELWFCVGLSYLFFESIRHEIMLLQRFENLRSHIWLWAIIQGFLSIVVSIVMISGALSIYFIEYVGYSFGTYNTELLTFNSIFVVTSVLYNMMFFGVYFLNSKNEALLSKENTARKNLEFQIQAFNSDINPRFLYSCLETLITLLRKKGRDAEKYVYHLSSIYRYILENKHNELSDLKSEVESLNDLIHLFNGRFNGQVSLKAEIKKDYENKQLITGTLSAVVEDLINNTIVSESQPLHIECQLDEDDNYFVIKNKMNDRLLVDEISRKRCDSLKEAYTYFTSQPFFQVKAHDESFVKVPIITV